VPESLRLGRRYFREELGESDLAQRYLEIFSQLGGEAAQILNDAIQASARIAVLKEQLLANGRPEEEIRRAAAKELTGPGIELRSRASNLKRHYVLLPSAIIQTLQSFEAAVWKTYAEPSFEGLALGAVIEAHDALLQSIRGCTRELIARKSPASAMIDNLAEGSYLPSYIEDAFHPSP